MGQAEREALARDYMALAESIAKTEARRLGKDVDRQELRSFALEGLAQSIDRWDETRGVAFGVFARPRIRGAIYDGLSKAGWFPRRLHRKISFYRKAENLVKARAEDPMPTTDLGVAEELADTLKELAVAYVTAWSMDEIPQTPSPENQLSAEDQVVELQYGAKVRELVEALPERQAHIVSAYFWQERLLADIAAEQGITISWASKLLRGALNTLGKRLALLDKQEQASLSPKR